MSIRASTQIAQLFREIVTLLLHSELDEAFPLVLGAVRELLPETTIGLYRYWPKTEELQVVAVVPSEETGSLVGTRLSLDGWRPGEVVRTRKAIHLPAVQLRPEAPAVELVCAPVMGADQDVLGVLQAASTRPNTFLDEDLNTLGAIASLVGLAEENVRRGEALQSAAISHLYSEYIAAMADMTSHITHRVVNEMGAIRLALQVLRRQQERDMLTPAGMLDKLDKIEQNATSTINLVRRIQRPFDKIETVSVQLEPLLDEVLSRLVPDDVVLIRQDALDLPSVMATRHLAEVFHHLVVNALEAMSTVKQKRLQVLTRLAEDKYAEIVVEDTGVGIAEHMQAGLFTFGASDKPDNMGHGLWWSRLYLARIGGTLDVDPSVRQGARFIVRVRVVEPVY